MPANVLDNNLNTRWSNLGKGSWIAVDLGSPQNICNVGIAWYQGDTRVNHFVVQGSLVNACYVNLLSRDGSAKSTAIELYNVAPTVARYVPIVVNGNTHGAGHSGCPRLHRPCSRNLMRMVLYLDVDPAVLVALLRTLTIQGEVLATRFWQFVPGRMRYQTAQQHRDLPAYEPWIAHTSQAC